MLLLDIVFWAWVAYEYAEFKEMQWALARLDIDARLRDEAANSATLEIGAAFHSGAKYQRSANTLEGGSRTGEKSAATTETVAASVQGGATC